MSLTNDIKKKVLESGFDLVGVTDAGPIDSKQVELLKNWLKSGFAGQMSYMHRNFEKRINPAKLLENAKSVIVVGLNYNLPKRTLPAFGIPIGKVASYALYEDYHTFIKERLCKVADFIISEVKQDLHFKICVDSAPLAERALAVRAGLGFIGKNHILINPELGCRIFLGEIITDLEFRSQNSEDRIQKTGDSRAQGVIRNTIDEGRGTRDEGCGTRCENCDKCIRSCPTQALRPDGQFDASRCINYLTIEYKGEISPELAGKIGNRLFGCEECILACPYQQNAPACKNKQFKFYPDRAQLDLQEVLDLTEESYEKKFSDSVIKRPGLDKLKRNARICQLYKK